MLFHRDALFDQRLVVALHNQVIGVDTGLLEPRAQRGPGAIVPDHAKKNRIAAKRGDVGGGMSRPTGDIVSSFDIDNGDGRFPTQPVHVPRQVTIQDGFTHDQHG